MPQSQSPLEENRSLSCKKRRSDADINRLYLACYKKNTRCCTVAFIHRARCLQQHAYSVACGQVIWAKNSEQSPTISSSSVLLSSLPAHPPEEVHDTFGASTRSLIRRALVVRIRKFSTLLQYALSLPLIRSVTTHAMRICRSPLPLGHALASIGFVCVIAIRSIRVGRMRFPWTRNFIITNRRLVIELCLVWWCRCGSNPPAIVRAVIEAGNIASCGTLTRRPGIVATPKCHSAGPRPSSRSPRSGRRAAALRMRLRRQALSMT